MRIDAQFQPAWWLANRHLQSCFTSCFPYRAKVSVRWEELTLPDGDFTDLVWAGKITSPIVILLHGLEGSVNSHYIQLMMDTLVEDGWQVVLMHYRACSGRINRQSQMYHGGDTKDLNYLIEVLQERHPNLPIHAAGFSLGGNILLHYVANNISAPIKSVVVVSAPYELDKSAVQLSMFYQRIILRSMKRKVTKKIKRGMEMPITRAELKHIKNLREFDDAVTAPLYGYKSAKEYYDEVSSRHLLKNIQHQTLIIHALDDPFVPYQTVPNKDELSPSITLELSKGGGHVGFISGGPVPGTHHYWLKDRIREFLRVQSY